MIQINMVEAEIEAAAANSQLKAVPAAGEMVKKSSVHTNNTSSPSYSVIVNQVGSYQIQNNHLRRSPLFYTNQ